MTIMTTVQFNAFRAEILDRLQAVSDAYLDRYDEHFAFDYLVAELFETTHEDKFVFTDGPKDGNVDFFVRDAQAYTIAQCKCPALDTIGDTPEVYDQSAVEQLKAAIDMLLDESGDYDVKTLVKQLRSDYQRDRATDQEGTSLSAILAILGHLSEPARATFNSYRRALQRQGVSLKLIQWEDVYHAMHALESPSDVTFEIPLHYDSEAELLSRNDYFYMLCCAVDFYEAFRKYEWGLFEWNVRFQIPNSPVNKRIVNALSHARSRKLFHHYNNGLLITCRAYRRDRRRNAVVLVGPQVINGCQTVRAICEAYENLSPEDQKDFQKHTRVQVKVIKTVDAEFIGELVISTNDQNPMNPRNLKSNTAEQRDIQRLFRSLPQKWFYERKDGEFKSLLSTSTQVRWFRKSDFAVSPRRFRVIDNQKLAKAWYAFVGYSHDVLRGGLDYFSDDPRGPYARVFQSTPSQPFWSAFTQPVFMPSPDYFTPGVPSVHQYLLAMAIANYIDARKISSMANRQEAVKRGIQGGVLKGDYETGRCTSPSREVSTYLLSDEAYFIGTMVINMKDLLVELYSFLLSMKYGACDPQTCHKVITQLPRHKEFLESACDPTILSCRQDGKALLGPIYEFLLYCVKQYYFENRAEIHASPRLKAYLWQRATVNGLRSLVAKTNEGTRDYDAEWKCPKKTFLASLPAL